MGSYSGKYVSKKSHGGSLPFWLISLSFFYLELFGFCFLTPFSEGFSTRLLWPMAFGLLWVIMLGPLLYLFKRKIARILYGILYFASAVYCGFQTGYYLLFSEMMWISDFRYAAEGSDYASVLFSYPASWWLGILGMILLGLLILWKFPRWMHSMTRSVCAVLLALTAAFGTTLLPERVFLHDSSIQYAGSDYGRAQSAEAAYNNMFNTHRLYQVCGLYQTAAKDIYTNYVFPLTPGHAVAQAEGKQAVSSYLAKKEIRDNAMTGLLKGKNVVMVLMESMDDWMIGDHTPTLQKLMAEGINFTDFYTPPYGGIRTFNTEFCINTGSFLSSQGGYAFDYVTNEFNQSLANLLTDRGYSAKTFHYNDPSFYSRGVFTPAMGYKEYVCYADYVEGTEKEVKNLLYDDLLLFSNPQLRQEFFRQDEKMFNFIITRSAHLSYKYNEVLSHWGLKKYPEYRGMTGNEETNCALLKARLVDDLFAGLLTALEDQGQLQNTVIIGVTDHYTYGYKDEGTLLNLSGVEEKLLLEKTPCFIWSPGLEAMEVDKTLNTSDLLPTVLNLLGVKTEYRYLGHDAFDESYPGWVMFSDGSWITGDVAYNAGSKKLVYLSADASEITAEFQAEMAEKVAEFTRINNLILETDYYRK